MADRRRLLIVGGMGYLGSRLAAGLTEYSDVTVTARTLGPIRERWLSSHRERIHAVLFDSTQQSDLPVDGEFEMVLNVALPSAAAAARNPEGSQNAAIATTRACLNLAKDGRAGTLVHFSTFHVYGSTPRPCFDESNAPDPRHPYSRNHLVCEQLIGAEWASISARILRATNIVGAPGHADLGEQSTLLFFTLCRQAAQSGRLSLHNDGLSYRDFLPFSDALAALRIVVAAGNSCRAAPLNLARGEATRLDVMAREIQEVASGILGRDIPLDYGRGKDAWRAPFRISNDRLKALGWTGNSPLRPEIEAAVQFFAANS